MRRLQQELEDVRRNGYAIDDQEFEEGLKCIGAPIRERSGAVVASISIAGPAIRLRAERMPALINTVVKAAARISAALGYRNAGRNLVSYPETPGT
jgi:DNA-binding IclR family transcriptional regulator